MKKTKQLIFALMLSFLVVNTLPSCLMTTKTQVGNYASQQGNPTVYAKSKQLWVFGIPVGRTSVNTPADGQCEIVTRYNTLDFVIRILTGGVINSYTIRVNVKQ